MSEIKRPKFIYGTQKDIEISLAGMVPIKGIDGVNEQSVSWWIHPKTCSIIHIIRVENRVPRESIFVWTETIYDPEGCTGFSTSGYKTVKIGGKAHPLHRVMALSCVPNDDPETKTLVRHIDRNKRNNSASNLRWVSHQEAQKNLESPKPKIKIKLNIKKPAKGDEIDGSIYH